jgi:alpha-L-fucosidase 2
MMIYPLYLENRDTPAKLPLLEKSTAWWLDTAAAAGQGSGWSLSAAASFHAAFAKGDIALQNLQALIAGKSRIGKSFANTMYAESGQNIETPLSAAQSIHDMILQSWGGAIRVFPAVPSAWPDLVFGDFRAQGAFLVSARRAGGRTAWVRIKSLAGEPCVLECDWAGDMPVLKGAGKMRRLGDKRIALSLRAGEEAVLHLPDAAMPLNLTPLPAQPGASNSYGVHGGS